MSSATAFDDAINDETYILILHESLYYVPKLGHSLLNPNQIHMNGIGFWDNPFDPNHSLCIETSCGVIIPLSLKGTKLSFNSRVPSTHELNTCYHIDMTSINEWNPRTVQLGAVITTKSPSTFDYRISQICTSNILFGAPDRIKYSIPNCYRDESVLCDINPCLIQLKELMTSKLNSAHSESFDVPSRRTFVSTERHLKHTAENLSELWSIGLKRAKAAIRVTTRRGTRSAILPLSRRYIADRRYNLKRLNGKFSTDTLYAEVQSIHISLGGI